MNTLLSACPSGVTNHRTHVCRSARTKLNLVQPYRQTDRGVVLCYVRLRPMMAFTGAGSFGEELGEH